jgi:hypothetical protein
MRAVQWAIAASSTLVAGVVFAASAPAQGPQVHVTRACYAQDAQAGGVSVEVNASGLPPGAEPFVQVASSSDHLLANHPVTALEQVLASPQGTVHAVLKEVRPNSTEPVVEKVWIQIASPETHAVYAEAPFLLTTRRVIAHPQDATPRAKVRFQLAGFIPGRVVYAHYIHAGRARLTFKLGKAHGPCGVLSARARLYPGRPRFTDYTVQFDNLRRYTRKARVKYRAKLETGRYADNFGD